MLCIPFAGGAASVYRTWPEALPASVELLAVQLPGRETRFNEPPIERLSTLIAALGDAVSSLRAPFAIYGHSLGALIGFHLTRELRRRGAALPVQLFVAARRAPQVVEASPLYRLPEAELITELRRLGGIPDIFFEEPDLMAYALPILRADLALNDAETYVDEPPLACPITALAGQTDASVPVKHVEAWRSQTAAAFDCQVFPGGHFFLQSNRDAVLATLSQQLMRIASAVSNASAAHTR